MTESKRTHADRRLLDEKIAWLTTVRRDGQPQSSPGWFLWRAGGRARERDITVTPVRGGRLEILVNGETVYDRNAEGTADFYPSLKEMRKAKVVLADAIAKAPVA